MKHLDRLTRLEIICIYSTVSAHEHSVITTILVVGTVRDDQLRISVTGKVCISTCHVVSVLIIFDLSDVRLILS